MMVRVVHGGADQGVESRVHSDVLLHSGVLDVVDRGEQDGGVADDVPSRLQDDGVDVRLLLDHVGEVHGELAHVHLLLLGLVRDADAASHVDELQVDAEALDLVDELDEDLHHVHERFHDLSAGADVCVDALDVES